MDKNSFDRERYRLGHTLVFFRAGALGFLEELRLATISLLISSLAQKYLHLHPSETNL